MLKSWEEHLGVVETIHEEEYECSSASSPSLSLSLSSPPTPLHSRVRSWTLATGEQTDVSIYVMGTRFRLHKAPLVSKSGYLRRQLTELSEITLPLNITADTFTLVTEFCYSTQVVLTPFNVAALRTAAELLDMTVGDNLKQITDAYFWRVVSADNEFALTIFRSCLKLLPEVETAASLLSRCVRSLDLAAGDQEEVDDCIEQIVSLPPQEFLVVTEVFQNSFGNHDLLYTIVDLYIKDHSFQISEDQKSDICNLVDCEKLSPEFLIHAVQNPRLPLRFIVRAMLIEQLNTRRAIFTETTAAKSATSTPGGCATLCSILRREAAAREAAQMKAEMDATSSRIQSMERELAGMKKLLEKSEKQIQELSADTGTRSAMEMGHSRRRSSMEAIPEEVMGDHGEGGNGRRVVDSSSRSSSFHFGIREAQVKREERGSVSFAGDRSGGIGRGEIISPSSCIDITPEAKNRSGNVGGKGLISRLKKKFWVSKSAGKVSGEGVRR